MMTDLEVLKTVRRDWTEDKYCSKNFAEGVRGFFVYGTEDIQSPHAVKWCVQGYIAKVMGFRCGSYLWSTDLYRNILEPLAHEQEYPYGNNLASINNDDGHAAALKIIDEAIRQLEACEQEEYACEELVGV